MTLDKICLNLGCGKRCIPDYINIDNAEYGHINFKQDIGDLWMFNDNEVDTIYCSHALEYFDREEAKKTLEEWYRVLKPGGTLRLAVPDFEAIVRVYQKYNDIEHRGILGPLFGRMGIDKTVMVSHSPDEIAHPTTITDYIYHRTVYDFNSLKKLLESVGFKNVKRYDVVEFFKTLPKGYDDQSFAFIPHKDPTGILISLNVEAKK